MLSWTVLTTYNPLHQSRLLKWNTLFWSMNIFRGQNVKGQNLTFHRPVFQTSYCWIKYQKFLFLYSTERSLSRAAPPSLSQVTQGVFHTAQRHVWYIELSLNCWANILWYLNISFELLWKNSQNDETMSAFGTVWIFVFVSVFGTQVCLCRCS